MGTQQTRHRGRTVLVWLAAAVAVLALLFVGAAWYFSSLLIDRMAIKDYSQDFPLTIAAADAESVSLVMDTDPDGDPTGASIAGVRLADDSYLQVGEVTQTDGDEVSRPVTRVFGTVPAAGTAAALDSRYFPDDPRVGLGLDFTEVQIDTPLGPSPAWFVRGESDTWAIFSHGRGATREEGLRMLQTTSDLGLPTLLVTFRDDVVGQREDGISNFGMTEWADLEAAVQYALDNGARDVVLLAASTGGAISMALLENSPLADSVVGMVLDAPVGSFEQTVDLGAAQEGLPVVGWPIPAPLVATAKWLTERRVDIDFEATDYAARVDDLDVPTLIVHGSEDGTNPLAASEELAETAPEGMVRLEVFEGAEHVWSWNSDPQRYDRLLAEHLRSVTTG